MRFTWIMFKHFWKNRKKQPDTQLRMDTVSKPKKDTNSWAYKMCHGGKGL